MVASGDVAVNLHQLADGVAVHLINYGDAVDVIDELKLTVRLAGNFTTAVAVQPGRSPESLELTHDAGYYHLRLLEVGLYSVIVLR